MTESHSQSANRSQDDWLRYDIPIAPNENSARMRGALLVGSDKRVLELGCSTGRVSEVMRAHGCRITGIEIDPQMAERARASCERIIIGDIDLLDLEAELGDERFDVIIATDVLEHLKDPRAALCRTRPFLSEDGYYVVSLPNIAHGSVRLALLSGQFRYTPMGLLDQTHLRFFTRASIVQLFEEAGLAIRHLERVEFPVEAVEVEFDKEAVPASVLASLNSDPDAVTYQYVVAASPMLPFEQTLVEHYHQELAAPTQSARGVWDEIRIGSERLQMELIRRDQAIAEQGQRTALLQGEIAERDRGIRFLRGEIAGRDRIIAERHRGIHFLQSEIAGRDRRLGGAQETVAALEQQAARLQAQIVRQAAGINWLRQEVARRDMTLGAIYRSRMWRSMNIFWRARRALARLRAVMRR